MLLTRLLLTMLRLLLTMLLTGLLLLLAVALAFGLFDCLGGVGRLPPREGVIGLGLNVKDGIGFDVEGGGGFNFWEIW
jgi:hypothetical protein